MLLSLLSVLQSYTGLQCWVLSTICDMCYRHSPKAADLFKNLFTASKSVIQSSSSIQVLFYSSTQEVIYSLGSILHKLTIVQRLNNILGKITEKYRKL